MAGFINVTKQMFFDREKVQKAMDRKGQKCLSSAGAFGRTVMKRGMRRRKPVSEVGGYPSSHSGELRNLIYFGYDAASKGVVIGPTLFTTKRGSGGSQTVPQLLNEGGRVTRIVTPRRGKSRRVIQTYRPRPFVARTRKVAAEKLLENIEKFDFK